MKKLLSQKFREIEAEILSKKKAKDMEKYKQQFKRALESARKNYKIREARLKEDEKTIN